MSIITSIHTKFLFIFQITVTTTLRDSLNNTDCNRSNSFSENTEDVFTVSESDQSTLEWNSITEHSSPIASPILPLSGSHSENSSYGEDIQCSEFLPAEIDTAKLNNSASEQLPVIPPCV